MKRFLLIICDYQGEYEHRTKVLLSSRCQTTANSFAKRIQRDWFDNESGYWQDKDQRFRCFNGGEIATEIQELKEIPELDYLVMKKYVTEM